jgi:hypothetical protein
MNTEEKKSVLIAFFLRPEIHLRRCQPGAGAPPCYTHSFPGIHPLDPSGRIGKRCTTVDCPRTAHTSTVANLPFDKSESGWL